MAADGIVVALFIPADSRVVQGYDSEVAKTYKESRPICLIDARLTTPNGKLEVQIIVPREVARELGIFGERGQEDDDNQSVWRFENTIIEGITHESPALFRFMFVTSDNRMVAKATTWAGEEDELDMLRRGPQPGDHLIPNRIVPGWPQALVGSFGADGNTS
ncbi:hypothetical protein B0H67DRAFT_645776 [Lasiosphaeris hirsuta]|uniref:Uncharacterized protein n=1 Tax=Lasiosphaeris hirsuta TaxID=260670 RepID=A0AA40AHW5_9PEZI|nr:hypothetical protein B0H67DRAFT_645776 [Lasiosphaeris hirsuta]